MSSLNLWLTAFANEAGAIVYALHLLEHHRRTYLGKELSCINTLKENLKAVGHVSSSRNGFVLQRSFLHKQKLDDDSMQNLKSLEKSQPFLVWFPWKLAGLLRIDPQSVCNALTSQTEALTSRLDVP